MTKVKELLLLMNIGNIMSTIKNPLADRRSGIISCMIGAFVTKSDLERIDRQREASKRRMKSKKNRV